MNGGFNKCITHSKPWPGKKTDKRRVIDLVEQWFNSHGITLADGEKRQTTMTFACDEMGNPLATEFNAKIFAAYREQRLSGKITRSSRVKTVPPAPLILSWLISERCSMNYADWMNEPSLIHLKM